MRDDFKALADKAEQAIHAATDLQGLDAARVQFLGKTGEVTGLLKQVGGLPPEERKPFGESVNALRDQLAAAIAARQTTLESAAMDARLKAEIVDVTLPVSIGRTGTIHPISQTTDEIISIFGGMGFTLATGPEIEDDFHNFTALNFAPDHPARSMHDTFFLQAADGEEQKLLRTHTSTVQIRHMLANKPPMKIIIPGRVFRSEMDATHTAMFHQVEGLVVDRIGKVHMGHLKGCITDFIQAYFGIDNLPTRFRPSFFPFTEPSAEIDIAYTRKDGKIVFGVADRWMEIGGCGMVHPNVLRQCGLDPEEYQGFAFGMGIERMAMLKYGIPDLRDMFDTDLRWLDHYGFSVLDQPNRATGS